MITLVMDHRAVSLLSCVSHLVSSLTQPRLFQKDLKCQKLLFRGSNFHAHHIFIFAVPASFLYREENSDPKGH